MPQNRNAELVYQIFCDDVRLEIGNKLSLMGIFQDIYVQKLPVILPKLAIVSQWRGAGEYISEVHIVSPDRVVTIANSSPTVFQIPENGYANNITFFINIQFERAGDYLVQTYLNKGLYTERKVTIGQIQPGPAVQMSEHIN
jgi:hypothetical protein